MIEIVNLFFAEQCRFMPNISVFPFECTFTVEAKWTQTGTRFHFGWKSHFGVQSALYLCSHELRRNETQNGMDFISVILTEMKFQTGMRFSCEQNFPETKWISADSLDIAFNAHVCLKLILGMNFISAILTEMNFISGEKIFCKHYPKWNVYTCPSKYRVDLKCSQMKLHLNRTCFHAGLKSQTCISSYCLVWTYSKHC